MVSSFSFSMCGGLALIWGQMPTNAAPLLPFLDGQGTGKRENITKVHDEVKIEAILISEPKEKEVCGNKNKERYCFLLPIKPDGVWSLLGSRAAVHAANASKDR